MRQAPVRPGVAPRRGSTIIPMLRRLRIENLVLIREAELELAPGLIALTGETGAGKTIVTQAIGLLLGAKGDAAAVGAAGAEAYVEAELDVPEGFFDEDGLEALRDLRPEDEPGLVVARRVTADGRSRAYAWGRSVAREDVVAATERLLALSGQFAQRRLARPSYQLDLLDAFVGTGAARAEERRARGLARRCRPPTRRLEELERGRRRRAGPARRARGARRGHRGARRPGEEDALRAERERIRHVAELGEGAAAARRSARPGRRRGRAHARRRRGARARAARASGARARDRGDGASRSRRPARRGRRATCIASRTSLDADPARLAEVEERLDRIADVRRRYRAATLEELLERRATALAELEAVADGGDPLDSRPRRARRPPRRATRRPPAALAAARRDAAGPFAAAVAGELADLGMGEGEFHVELAIARAGPPRAPTRPSSSSARTPGSRSRRSRRRRPAASCPASRSRSPPSRAARPSSSTRSTQASEA